MWKLCLCKGKKSCLNCLPSRLGSCQNAAHPTGITPTTTTTTTTAHDQTPSTTPTDEDLTAPDTSNSEPEQDPTQPTSTDSQNVRQHEVEPLPCYTPISEPNFVWGCEDSQNFKGDLNRIYDEAVHWRRNLFKVPSGKPGKSFVRELTRLFRAYAEGSALEGVALKAAMTICQHYCSRNPAQSLKRKNMPHTLNVD